MSAKSKASVIATIVADSHALGTHWVYDKGQLKSLGEVRELIDPVSQYHAGKRSAGQNTHYGDQTRWLLRHVADTKAFNGDKFFASWVQSMKKYDGYLDGASKNTLANVDAGTKPAGSSSHDFSAVGRIAPLLLVHADEEAFVNSAKAQTALTHNEAHVIEAAELIARILFQVANKDVAVNEAIEKAVAALPENADVRNTAEAALAAAKEGVDDAAAGDKFGVSCPWDKSLPLTLFVLAKPDQSLEDALVRNSQIGGDNAARALVIGAILGAAQGESAIPERWLTTYKYTDELRQLIAKL